MSTIYQDPIDRSFDPSQQASVWPSALKWGAIAGAVGCVLTLISYNLGYMDVTEDGELPGSGLMTFVSLLAYVGLMYVGLKGYRDGENGGFLTFGRGVLWSLGFGIASGVVAALFSLLFYGLLAPDYLADLYDTTVDQMDYDRMSEEEIAATETMFGYTFSTPFMAATAFFSSLIMPLLIGLVLSLILRKDS